MRTIYRLNEEIARWAFEILFKTNSAWHIAFTNPTAGPWKTIKAVSLESGQEGEVYRFILEEDRPDIVMYNDHLEVVLIFEAKDSLEKLLEKKQADKSAAVVEKLAGILRAKAENSFWKGRGHYKVVSGLLWGSTGTAEEEPKKEQLYDCYHDRIRQGGAVYPGLIVGVETLYRNGALTCAAFFKSYCDAADGLGSEIVRSLTRPPEAV